MFRIQGLPAARFAHLFGADDATLGAHNALRQIVTAKPGAPCRITLDDAEPGETVLLVNHEHQPAPTPYRASHAVFVRESATQPFDAEDALPPALRGRLLSLRAFDARDMMIDASVVDGAEAEAEIVRLLRSNEVAYLHAHFAKRGCFACRVDRA